MLAAGCHPRRRLAALGRQRSRPQYVFARPRACPSTFDPGKFKPNSEEVDLSTTKNVKWVAKLGSQTYGNPVVANGKVFVGTNNASPRDPKYKDDRSCL